MPIFLFVIVLVLVFFYVAGNIAYLSLYILVPYGIYRIIRACCLKRFTAFLILSIILLVLVLALALGALFLAEALQEHLPRIIPIAIASMLLFSLTTATWRASTRRRIGRMNKGIPAPEYIEVLTLLENYPFSTSDAIQYLANHRDVPQHLSRHALRRMRSAGMIRLQCFSLRNVLTEAGRTCLTHVSAQGHRIPYHDLPDPSRLLHCFPVRLGLYLQEGFVQEAQANTLRREKRRELYQEIGSPVERFLQLMERYRPLQRTERLVDRISDLPSNQPTQPPIRQVPPPPQAIDDSDLL